MNNVTDVLPFNLDNNNKKLFLLSKLNDLTEFHLNNCKEYRSLTEKFKIKNFKAKKLREIPYVPVRLFKHFKLLSIPETSITKVMVSSGTSNNKVSKVYLDKNTSALQVKVLSKIVTDFIGSKRLPFLIIDSKSIINNKQKFSARSAGALGFSIFGKEIEYALEEDMSMNIERIQNFIKKFQDKKILIFGFTFVVWKYFIKELQKRNIKLDFSNSILIHGGGWKNMELESIDNDEFKNQIKETINVSKIHNYYGMVEQTGSIYMECEFGYLHSSSFSDVIIRDHKTHEILGVNKTGLIQLLSVIPKSYPGHSLLSEDIGEIFGVDDCKCGRKGSYFKVFGRMASAESRGCSDTITP